MLRQVCPLAEKDAGLLERYHGRWQELNQYVHPSAYVMDRMIDEAALLVRDGFDERWARDTIAAGRDVFDLVWLAILLFHPLAIPMVAEKGLIVRYRVVGAGLEGFRQEP